MLELTKEVRHFEIPFSELSFSKRILGRGGYGEVILGQWQGHQVAIKKMHSANYGIDEEYNNMMIKEIIAEAVAYTNLRSPCIVQYFGFSRHKNIYYLITEFIPRGSLDDNLKLCREKKLTLSFKKKLQFSIDIASGIKYLFGKNLVNRDIKPKNILITKDFRAKICDFGLARVNTKHTDGLVGTALYRAPEIIKEANQGKNPQHTFASDVYSYGVTLYSIFMEIGPHEMPLRTFPTFKESKLNGLVDIMKLCCAENPSERMNLDEVIRRLNNIKSRFDVVKKDKQKVNPPRERSISTGPKSSSGSPSSPSSNGVRDSPFGARIQRRTRSAAKLPEPETNRSKDSPFEPNRIQRRDKRPVGFSRKTDPLKNSPFGPKISKIKKYANGDQYEGKFNRNGKRHGYGTLHYRSGAFYKGLFKEGRKHGSGKYVHKSGSFYDGQFFEDKKHGKGTEFVKSNGQKYEGYWEHGKKHGTGTSYYPQKNEYSVGEWKEGNPIGKAVIYEIGTSIKLREGEWVNKGGEMFFILKEEHSGNDNNNLMKKNPVSIQKEVVEKDDGYYDTIKGKMLYDFTVVANSTTVHKGEEVTIFSCEHNWSWGNSSGCYVPTSYIGFYGKKSGHALVNLEKGVAKYNYKGLSANEISLKENEVVIFLEMGNDWTLIRRVRGNKDGYVPTSYIKKI